MAVGALLAALGRTANGLDATLAAAGEGAALEALRCAGRACDALFAAVIEAAAGEDGASPDDVGLVFEALFSVARGMFRAGAMLGEATDADAATVGAAVRLLAEALSVTLASGLRGSVPHLRGMLDRLFPVLTAAVDARRVLSRVDTLPLWRQAVRLLVEARPDDYVQRTFLLGTLIADAGRADPSALAQWTGAVRACLLACRHALQPGRGHAVDAAAAAAGLRALLVAGGCAELLALPVAVTPACVDDLDALAAEVSLPEDANFAKDTLGYYLRVAVNSGSVSSALKPACNAQKPPANPSKRPNVQSPPGLNMREERNNMTIENSHDTSSNRTGAKRKGKFADMDDLAYAAPMGDLPHALATLEDLMAACAAQWAMPATGRVVPRHTASLVLSLVGGIHCSVGGVPRALLSALLRRVLARCDAWGLVGSAATSADGGGVVEQLLLAAHASRLADAALPHAAAELFVRERLAFLFGRMASLPLLVRVYALSAAANVAREYGTAGMCARLLPLLLKADPADAPVPWASAVAACLRHADAPGVSAALEALAHAPPCSVWPIVAALPFCPAYAAAPHGALLTSALARGWPPGAHAALALDALRAAEVFLRAAPDAGPMEAVSGLAAAAVPFLERAGMSDAGAFQGRPYVLTGPVALAVPRIVVSAPASAEGPPDAEALLSRLRAAMASDPSLVARVRALLA